MRLADLPGFRRYWLLFSFAASRYDEFVEWCQEMEVEHG